MTKREKQLQYTRSRIKRMEKDRELGIKLLVRATLELPKLRKEEARLETVLAKRQKPTITDEMIRTELFPGLAAVEGRHVTLPEEGDGLDIPAKFRREPPAGIKPEVYEAAHAVANAHNKAPTEEQKKLVAKEKRKVKEEHKHAELTGKKRKWPATGKDALAQLK